MSSRGAVDVTRHLDAVVANLKSAGVAVARVEVDLDPSAPLEARLVTERGNVLRWDQDRGWAGRREGETAARPTSGYSGM
ncbi:hypothetical protein [Saccharothrix yanglingensis]|uniref:hypothetical protein n=1 Tax=Saccharothrix yanglingensis TaxID=659496 RepID=UPI0027D32371|nr:hypothetical protein [Saccharothrix yanglingensis]